jgi:hypothetical protein
LLKVSCREVCLIMLTAPVIMLPDELYLIWKLARVLLRGLSYNNQQYDDVFIRLVEYFEHRNHVLDVTSFL